MGHEQHVGHEPGIGQPTADPPQPFHRDEAFEDIKEALTRQLTTAMTAQQLSRKRLAERMQTSRSQVRRLLDPKDGNVTIATLQRAAKVVGRKLRVELV
jgi:predicted XRE-type DNA-binding protein